MIGDFEVPRIERIATVESRRLARLSVPGLAGDLHQDLGVDSIAIEICGSLQGDTERDDFLNSIRDAFNAGDAVDFVADIATATELEQVLVEGLHVEEVNDAAGCIRYRSACGSTSSHRRHPRRSTTSVPTSGPTSTHSPASASTASSYRTCSATSRRSATRRRRSRPRSRA